MAALRSRRVPGQVGVAAPPTGASFAPGRPGAAAPISASLQAPHAPQPPRRTPCRLLTGAARGAQELQGLDDRRNMYLQSLQNRASQRQAAPMSNTLLELQQRQAVGEKLQTLQGPGH